MSRYLWLALALGCFVLGTLPPDARAQASRPVEEPLVTDRPDFTESAVTVAPRRVQLELGYTFTRVGDEEQHALGELLVRAGVLTWLEARVGLNSFALTRGSAGDADGLEDFTLGLKAVVARPAADAPALLPEAALLLGADLPTGSDAFGADEIQPGATLALAWEPSNRVGLASNVGWASLAADGERYGQGTASVALGYSIDESLSAYGEWYGLFPETRDGDASHYLNGGFAWRLGPDLQLDWRIGLGLGDPDPNWFSGAGLSLRL